jgi:peptide/nickel transport system ATP-binding protein/oligopeptide transport system ATP-binding protein
MSNEKTLISVQNISKHYIIKENIISKRILIKAVDDVSFNIRKGESLGLIGESGSGKTTTALMILKLIKADEGKIFYKDIELTGINNNGMRSMRKELQIIFQHSQGALDPKMTVEELLMEPLKLHNIVKSFDMDKEISRLLRLVELSESDKLKFLFQLSGGQRQRIGIARAISIRPSFIICDEPVSALDVSVQGQILNLLDNLKDELDLTYLFIAHDLKVVKHICDRIAVMYKGKIVECGHTKQILNEPSHEYTKKLVSSVL